MWHVDHHRLFMHNKPPLTVTVARGVCVSVHKKKLIIDLITYFLFVVIQHGRVSGKLKHC